MVAVFSVISSPSIYPEPPAFTATAVMSPPETVTLNVAPVPLRLEVE